MFFQFPFNRTSIFRKVRYLVHKFYLVNIINGITYSCLILGINHCLLAQCYFKRSIHGYSHPNTLIFLCREEENKMCQMLVDIAQAIQIIIFMIGNYYWAGVDHTITISPPYISGSVQVVFPSLQHSPPIYIMRQVALMVPTVHHRQHIGTTSTNIAQILTSRNKINIQGVPKKCHLVEKQP